MPASRIACPPTVEPALPAGLADDILRRTGVAVAFYRPDGRRADSADPPGAALSEVDPPAREVARVAACGEDSLEFQGDELAAVWPVRRRNRVIFVAAARVEADGPRGRVTARGLMQAVIDSVRARVEADLVAGERDSIVEALSQSFEEVTLLHNLGEILRVTRPVHDLLQYVCEELRHTTGAAATAAFLPQAEGLAGETVVVGSLPMLPADLPAFARHLLASLDDGEVVLINNHCQDDPAIMGFSTALERVVMATMCLRDGVRGVILAFNRPDEEFGSPDAKLIRSSANASAVFIENRRLYNELQRLMLDLVRALVSSVDAKDPYTCGHSLRVAITSREIAREMGLSDEEVQQAYLAGLLHDIGKIGTPEGILCKSGRLLPEERAVIEQHPVTGAHILSGIRQLDGIRGAVVHHHERPDGKGYPDGVSGDDWPPLARIVGLADAFDAMTSNRPYRPMLPLEHVLAEIDTHTGAQFDAEAAAVFRRIDKAKLMQMFVDEPRTVSSGREA
jgi:putative nucleotidyltransferase with HDIG domain